MIWPCLLTLYIFWEDRYFNVICLVYAICHGSRFYFHKFLFSFVVLLIIGKDSITAGGLYYLFEVADNSAGMCWRMLVPKNSLGVHK